MTARMPSSFAQRFHPALSGLLLVASLLYAQPASARHVNVLVIDGGINAAVADFVQEAIKASEEDGAALLLIEMDTPGGVLQSTQDIIQSMLNAQLPTAVYVTPRGAWAGSAGVFITMAANVAAMSPGSSIGAAHPVFSGGENKKDEGEGRDYMMEKVENMSTAYIESIAKQRNRNVEWAADAVRNSVAVTAEEAVELNVVDLIAKNRAELLAAIDGRVVEVDGEEWTLELADAEIVPVEMNTLQAVFNFIGDPNIVALLIFAGLAGLYLEFQNPGMLVPGVTGLVLLLLAGFALQVLPFNWVGILLILIGLGLLVAEIFVTSFGTLFAAGIVCFLIGGSMAFDRPEISDLTIDFWSVLVPAVVAMGGFTGLVAIMVGRTLMRAQTAGVDEMLGLVGRTSTALEPSGKIFIRGEYWNVDADEPIGPGEPVEVVAVDGLRLRVRRASRTHG
jgi:membrane-bound serine protease (ClpP class)